MYRLPFQQCGGILGTSVCNPASSSHAFSAEPTGREQKTTGCPLATSPFHKTEEGALSAPSSVLPFGNSVIYFFLVVFLAAFFVAFFAAFLVAI
jgi:hypothetical protein